MHLTGVECSRNVDFFISPSCTLGEWSVDGRRSLVTRHLDVEGTSER